MINMLRRWRDTTGFFASLHRRDGAVADYRIFRKRFSVVFEPELMEEILLRRHACFQKGAEQRKAVENPGIVTAEGADHLWRRKLIQPSFSPKALKGYAAAMADEILARSDAMRDGEQVDVDHWAHELSLSIATRTFFGDAVDVTPAHIRDALAGYRWMVILGLLPMNRALKRLPLPRTRGSRRAIRRLDERLYEAIRAARADEGERTDLIAHLVRSWDEGHPDGSYEDSQLKAEVFAVLIAGHETTAATLTWCLYHLARNPDARERMEREIDGVLGGGRPGFDDVPNLSWTKAVVDETMRMTPTATYLGRTAMEDVEVGEHCVRKDTIAQLSIRTPMNKEEYFPDPERFQPERWLGFGPDVPRMAYAPFGAGHRFCSGHRFATIELVLALAIVGQRWRLDLVDPDPPPVRDMIVYKVREGLMMTASRRSGLPG